jgi:hypothetical protein
VESRAAGGPWQEHARGNLSPLGAPPPRQDVAAIAARCGLSDQTGGWESFMSG